MGIIETIFLKGEIKMKGIKEIVTSKGFKKSAIGVAVSVGLTILADVVVGVLTNNLQDDEFDNFEEVKEDKK